MFLDKGMAHGEVETDDMERVIVIHNAVEGLFEKEKMEEVKGTRKK